jgi:hypothetical protein
MERQLIIDRVLSIKENLLKLHSEYLKSNPEQDYDRVIIKKVELIDLEELTEYPLEYQIFLEQIGEVYIAYCDCFMIEVCLPQNMDDIWWFEDYKSLNPDNFRIIVHTDNDNIYYVLYDISKTPFERFYGYYEDYDKNFLDIIEEKIGELLRDYN